MKRFIPGVMRLMLFFIHRDFPSKWNWIWLPGHVPSSRFDCASVQKMTSPRRRRTREFARMSPLVPRRNSRFVCFSRLKPKSDITPRTAFCTFARDACEKGSCIMSLVWRKSEKIRAPVNEKAALWETYWGRRRQRAAGVCALLSGRQSRLKGCLSSFRRDCRTASSQIFFNLFIFSSLSLRPSVVALRTATPAAQTVDIETLGKIWDPIGDEGRRGVSYVPSAPGPLPWRCRGPYPFWQRPI